LFAVLVTVIGGGLFRLVRLAVFGTTEGFVVTAAAAGALPAQHSAFVDLL